jgi:hypothetical protein
MVAITDSTSAAPATASGGIELNALSFWAAGVACSFWPGWLF